MNRDNAAAQLQDLGVAASGKAIPIAYANGQPSKWLFSWGTGAPSGTPDARLYFQTGGTTTTTCLWHDVNGTWTAITIS